MIFSADRDTGGLGTGTFQVDDKVKTYIVSKLRALTGRLGVTLTGSVFDGPGGEGDFSRMVQETLDSGRAPRRLLIFNDNSDHHETTKKGDGNAAVRPFNEHGKHRDRPLSAGICTGSLATGGYTDLTPHAQATIDGNLDSIERILSMPPSLPRAYGDRSPPVGQGSSQHQINFLEGGSKVRFGDVIYNAQRLLIEWYVTAEIDARDVQIAYLLSTSARHDQRIRHAPADTDPARLEALSRLEGYFPQFDGDVRCIQHGILESCRTPEALVDYHNCDRCITRLDVLVSRHGYPAYFCPFCETEQRWDQVDGGPYDLQAFESTYGGDAESRWDNADSAPYRPWASDDGSDNSPGRPMEVEKDDDERNADEEDGADRPSAADKDGVAEDAGEEDDEDAVSNHHDDDEDDADGDGDKDDASDRQDERHADDGEVIDGDGERHRPPL